MESSETGKTCPLQVQLPRWRRRPRAIAGGLPIVVLLLHALLLGFGGLRNSPTWDEPGHLAAASAFWQFGRFDPYAVNPPLVRFAAGLPVFLFGPPLKWEEYRETPDPRFSTLQVGAAFIHALGLDAFWYFTLARWACIPFSLLGGWVCYCWASELYGRLSGNLALVLWCFSPNVLAHGQLITSDVGAASLGVTACYFFWCWLRTPRLETMLWAGTSLGFAQLTKMTLLVFFVAWPVTWLAMRLPTRRPSPARAWSREAVQLAGILILGLFVLNLGYGFQGSFQRLGDYEFTTRALGGLTEEQVSEDIMLTGGNRFRGSWLARVPVPLPRDYVRGLDQQKRDFEQRPWSYLRGEWRRGGWWYYYLYAIGVRVPVGQLLLVVLAVLLCFSPSTYSAGWEKELAVLAPCVIVLAFISSQTGFSHDLRYALPVFPFAFIWSSKVAIAVRRKDAWLSLFGAVALAWSVASSLWVYPHCLSYFNELGGGPTRGHYGLLNSNTDWGQDLLYLKGWLDDHPEARPLGLLYVLNNVYPHRLGIAQTAPPPGLPAGESAPENSDLQFGPQPGWYAISINHLFDRSGRYSYFLRFEPVATAGYSIWIYHVTRLQANSVRRELGMCQIGETQ